MANGNDQGSALFPTQAGDPAEFTTQMLFIPGFARGFMRARNRRIAEEERQRSVLMDFVSKNPEGILLPGVQRDAKRLFGPDLVRQLTETGKMAQAASQVTELQAAVGGNLVGGAEAEAQPFTVAGQAPQDVSPSTGLIPGQTLSLVTPTGRAVVGGETAVRPPLRPGAQGAVATTVQTGPSGTTVTRGPTPTAEQVRRGEALFREVQKSVRATLQRQNPNMGWLEANVRAAAAAAELPGAIPTARGQKWLNQAPNFLQAAPTPPAAPGAPVTAQPSPGPAPEAPAASAAEIGPQSPEFGQVFPLQPGEEDFQPAPTLMQGRAVPVATDAQGQRINIVDAALKEAAQPKPNETMAQLEARQRKVAEAQATLDTPITDASKLALWVDPQTGQSPKIPMSPRQLIEANYVQVESDARKAMQTLGKTENIAATLARIYEREFQEQEGRFAAGVERKWRRWKGVSPALQDMKNVNAALGNMVQIISGEGRRISDQDAVRVGELNMSDFDTDVTAFTKLTFFVQMLERSYLSLGLAVPKILLNIKQRYDIPTIEIPPNRNIPLDQAILPEDQRTVTQPAVPEGFTHTTPSGIPYRIRSAQ